MASGSGLPETREVTMCLEMLSVRAFAVQKGWGVSELSGTRPTLSTQTESVCPPPHIITVQRQQRRLEATRRREWAPHLEGD